MKFNGEQHLPLTPGEYTQLTGRAGRRGIDIEGHAVVLWQPGDPTSEPAEVAGLASTRTFPLRSSFAPSYNMTINLVNRSAPSRLIGCWSSRSPSIRPTGRWSAWSAAWSADSGCSTRSRPSSAEATRRSSTTRGCGNGSPNMSGRRPAHRDCNAGRRPTMRWRRCVAVTSSRSPTAAVAAWPLCWKPTGTATTRGRWC